MRFKILIAAAALALPLSACETMDEPPSGEIIGGICRGATLTLNIATGLKGGFTPEIIAIADEAATSINGYCSSTEVPTITFLIVQTITLAVARLLPIFTAEKAVVPQGAAAVVVWPPIRDGWNVAYAAWKAA